jgi:predicted ArsR family transcriptional regulator
MRYRMLSTISEHGPIGSVDVGLRVGLDGRNAATHVANLLKFGLVEAVGEPAPTRGQPKLYAITARGREKLANPAAVKVPVLDGDLAEIRRRYAVTHDEHVKLQKKLGIPKALIEGKPIDYTMPAVRG